MRITKEQEDKITNQFLINLVFGMLYLTLIMMARSGRMIQFNLDSRPFIMAISATVGTAMLIFWNMNHKRVGLRAWGVFFIALSLMCLGLVLLRPMGKLHFAEKSLLYGSIGYIVVNVVVYLVRMNIKPKRVPVKKGRR